MPSWYKDNDNKNTVQGAVYTALKNSIMSLQLKPGTVMSTQEIATKLNVSRTPVREAFIRLQREGLVDIYPQKETIVSKINLNRVREERFIRESLEIAVLSLFIKKCTERDIANLRMIIQAQKKFCEEKDYIQFLEMDIEFHKIFYDVAEQQLAWDTIKNVNGHYNRIRLMSVWSEEIIYNAIKQHEDIVDAILKKDERKARQEMTYHLEKLIVEKNIMVKEYPEYFESEEKKDMFDLSGL